MQVLLANQSRKAFDGRGLKHHRGVEVDTIGLFNFPQKPDRGKRLPTELKKIIPPANLRKTQQTLPPVCQGYFDTIDKSFVFRVRDNGFGYPWLIIRASQERS